MQSAFLHKSGLLMDIVVHSLTDGSSRNNRVLKLISDELRELVWIVGVWEITF
jgi:hypothetical protein